MIRKRDDEKVSGTSMATGMFAEMENLHHSTWLLPEIRSYIQKFCGKFIHYEIKIILFSC
jgi:hypothetical protein